MQKILRKRVMRDLKKNLFRYMALAFLIMLGMYIIVSLIGAADTIMQGTVVFQEKNHVEDGEFSTFIPLTDSELDKLAGQGITVEEMFYLDFSVETDASVLRVFKNRQEINLVEVDEGGRLASEEGEIVIEKRYGEEHQLTVGDSIRLGDEIFTITGFCSTPDYDGLFQKLSDSNADSASFGTAFVIPEDYQQLKASGKSAKSEEYVYSYLLKGKLDDKTLKEQLKDFDFDAEDAKDEYFKEYWEETGGKKDTLVDGVNDLYDGALELKDGLNELTDNNDALNDASEELFDAYLDQAYEGLKSYGLKKKLTAQNFETELTALRNQNEGIIRLSIGNLLSELKKIKEFKVGIANYTDGAAQAAEGSLELADGVQELKDATDELVDQYFDVGLSNLTMFLAREDNLRIGAGAEDQIVNKQAGLAIGVVIMILFTYVISVFVVHNIEQESSVIGALYSMGVKRKELITHYLMLPVVITSLAGVIGVVAALTSIGIPMQMQDCFNYFSLPEFDIIVPPYLLVYGMVMPPIIAVLVNYMVIRKKLSRTALSLLRNEAKQPKGSDISLGNMGFMGRFRVRQMLREARTGLTVVFGMFISLLCVMIGLNCYTLCHHISQGYREDTRFEYMYTYKYPEEHVPEGGEAAYGVALNKMENGYNMEVTLLGIDDDNPYFDVEPVTGMNQIIISSSTAQRFGWKTGDSVVLTDREEDRDYAFTVAGIAEYSTSLYAFMDIDSMRELFATGDDYFNVVFADHKLDIESGRLYATTTRAQIEKGADVFSELMQGMIIMVTVVSSLIFCVVMYLMMKVMIDRAAFSISLMKIFGFRMGEIKRLYLDGNFFIILGGAIICVPLAKWIMDTIYPTVMVPNTACGIDLTFEWYIYVMLYAGIIVFYLIVNKLLVGRLKKLVPAEVLKNRE